ncbi:uncharacterized protein PV09_06793 [Verruconis gallopava]|uniref:Elongator complex protein 4 n=1 Tax=Verruconis gallopava TaxID=253628 RepID=A0A0D1XI55_9PEZI|nr:uncharacterized protein PV09_06793 [Verruconis gallopava]KIW01956.1 hypothetical protein PV09_06793 [Verruconis gallopava]
MSFRKRNVVLAQKGENPTVSQKQTAPGVRPSPVTGHPTTSTGTESLDKLLALGGGLALGSNLMLEEDGATEFAKSLLSCYAAEGVLQGHAVFVVGPDGSLLMPGVAEENMTAQRNKAPEGERMKIAWRYERLGTFGERERGSTQQQKPINASSGVQDQVLEPFCHTFDLTKRLSVPPSRRPPAYIAPTNPTDENSSPFASIVKSLALHLDANPSTPTRLVIPSLLNPLIYSPLCCQPQMLLGFLHSVRSLLRKHSTVLTSMFSWPLALFPDTHPLTRWARHLSDGVIALHPFPHSFSIEAIDLDIKGGSGSNEKVKTEEKMQGLIKMLKLPVLTEKGVGLGSGEDMAFAVGRRRFLIRPFHLPPLEGETKDTAHDGDSTIESNKLEF